MNKLLRESGAVPEDTASSSGESDADEWDGIPDAPSVEILDQAEEYVDEDRYTTVTVESVAISRDGFEKPPKAGTQDADTNKESLTQAELREGDHANSSRPKKKKKKFRYETKIERQLTDRKQRAKGRTKRP